MIDDAWSPILVFHFYLLCNIGHSTQMPNLFKPNTSTQPHKPHPSGSMLQCPSIQLFFCHQQQVTPLFESTQASMAKNTPL
jgi:hypothetical protein